MPSDWTDAKKEAEERMTKRRGDQAVRAHTAGKERAMARRSKPGGVTPAEHKAFRDTAVGKAMGRVFQPKKAREADAAEARDAAFAEAMGAAEAVEASPPVEKAVAAAPTASAAPEKPPGMIFYDDTATDGTIRYQPKGDPWQYRLLPDGTFQVTDPKTGAVKASAAKGSDAYQAFQDHYDAAMGTGDWKWKASGDAPADAAVPAAPDAAAGAVPLGDMPRSDEGSIPIGEMSPSEGPVNLPRVTPEVEGTPFDVAEPLDQPYTTDLGFDPTTTRAPEAVEAPEAPAIEVPPELIAKARVPGRMSGTERAEKLAAKVMEGELSEEELALLVEAGHLGAGTLRLVKEALDVPEGRGPTHQVGVRQFPPTPSEMRQIRERAARAGFEPTRTPAKYENTLRIPD